LPSINDCFWYSSWYLGGGAFISSRKFPDPIPIAPNWAPIPHFAEKLGRSAMLAAGHNHEIKIADRSFENVAKFEYLRTRVSNQI
jgi:hypothetical protein